MNFDLHHGDCLQVLATLPDACVDAVVTDPPYGLAFMGKRWDYDVPSVEIWAECLRVLKPGGHLLAFAGTRTQHRMAVRIEDAGFEIRDMLAWVYGSGFPKSMDVSKAIDKAAGAEREVVGKSNRHVGVKTQRLEGLNGSSTFAETPGMGAYVTAPATPEAQQWDGWGTALKPALEPITMARKPIAGTVAANVLAHGTGAINVDGCRVGAGEDKGLWPVTQRRHNDVAWTVQPVETDTTKGRWPANLIHDGSDETSTLLSDAARFFYTPKASTAERQGVTHPTVKPLDLMAYLCRLITPPNGTILDPFMGSGTTIKAAMSEGFKAIGIERDPDYFAMAQQRLNETQLGFQLL
jgi:DNA modification methylase